MLHSTSVYTESRHYNLPRQPQEVPSIYSQADYKYYTKDRYVLEQRRGCKPVFLCIVTKVKSQLHTELHRIIRAPWVIFYNTVYRRRQRFFQEWREDID